MAQEIGSATAIQGHVTAIGPEGARTLSTGSAVFKGDTVATDKASAGSIQFLDHTVLNVGEASKVSLNQYVYDANKGTGQVLFKLAQGTFRTVTGEIVKHNPESFKMQSPLATIGIRGTETAHTIPDSSQSEASESHLIMVFDGKPVVVQPLGGGQFQVLSQSGVKVDVGKFGAGPVMIMTPQEFKYFQSLTATGLQQGVPHDTVSPTAPIQGQNPTNAKTQAAQDAAAKAAADAAAKAGAADAAAKAAADAAAKAAAAAASGDSAAKAAADAAAKAAADAAVKAAADAKAAAAAAAQAQAEAFAAQQAQALAAAAQAADAAAKAAADAAAKSGAEAAAQTTTMNLTVGSVITVTTQTTGGNTGGSSTTSGTTNAGGTTLQVILSSAAAQENAAPPPPPPPPTTTTTTTENTDVIHSDGLLDFSHVLTAQSLFVYQDGTVYYGATGTSMNVTEIHASNHGDDIFTYATSVSLVGGTGNDTFVYEGDGSVPSNVSIDGGGNTGGEGNVLEVNANVDFSQAANFVHIQTVEVTAGNTATFLAPQIDGSQQGHYSEVANIYGSGLATGTGAHIVVNSPGDSWNYDFSNIAFHNWTTADELDITGAFNTDTFHMGVNMNSSVHLDGAGGTLSFTQSQSTTDGFTHTQDLDNVRNIHEVVLGDANTHIIATDSFAGYPAYLLGPIIIDGSAIGSTAGTTANTLTFDASGIWESYSFYITGSSGHGGDTLLGGGGDDHFIMGTHMTSADSIDGGDGTNTLYFTQDQGHANYTHDLDNVDHIQEVVLGDANTSLIAGGGGQGMMTFDATAIDSHYGTDYFTHHSLTFDGSAQDSGGSFNFLLGQGVEHVTGGAGDDSFHINADVGTLSAGSVIDGGGYGYGNALYIDHTTGGSDMATVDLRGVEIDHIQYGEGTNVDVLMDAGHFVNNNSGVMFDNTSLDLTNSKLEIFANSSGGVLDLTHLASYQADESSSLVLHGGTGDDLFLLGPQISGTIEADGGGGHDSLLYQSSSGNDNSATISVTDIEHAKFTGDGYVAVTASLSDTAPSGFLVYDASDMSGEQFSFDGSAIGSAIDSTHQLIVVGAQDAYSSNSITGGHGADVLIGGQGYNSITGGAGADTLVGGTGQSSSNTFHFHAGDLVSGETLTAGGSITLTTDAANADTDFRQMTFDLIGNGSRELDLLANGSTATFKAADMSGGNWHIHGGLPDQALTLYGADGVDNTIDISHFDFSYWGDISYTHSTVTLNGGDHDNTFNLSNIDPVATGLHVNGGAGTNTVTFADANAGVSVDLGTGTLDSGNGPAADVLHNIQNVIGSMYYNDVITGDGGDNVIEGLGGNDTLSGGSSHGAHGDTVSYEHSTMNGVVVNLGDYIETPEHVTIDAHSAIDGFTGHDTLVADTFQNVIGSIRSDIIVGDGHDNIIEGLGSVFHDANHDGLTLGTAFQGDVMYGGGYDNLGDTVSYQHLDGGFSGLDVNLMTQTATYFDGTYYHADKVADFQNIIGSDHGDTLTGDMHANNILGGAGNDLIVGMGSMDHVNGLGTLGAPDAGDTLDGGGGVNTVSYANLASYAGVTIDLTNQSTTYGTATYTDINTHVHEDHVSNFQNVVGTAFDDTITGDSHDNTFYATEGNDVYHGGGGHDTLDYSGFISDFPLTINIAANAGTSSYYTDTQTFDGITHIIGGQGDDSITNAGGGTAVIMEGGGGNDILTGGGADTVSYEHYLAGVTVDLSGGTAAHGYDNTDTLSGFANVIGTHYSDSITGGTGDNVIEGLGGGDTLNGGGHGDGVIGDTVSYQHLDVGVTVDLTNVTATYAGLYPGIDTLYNFQNIIGSDHGDTLIGDSQANNILGGAGDDLIIGGGNDSQLGGDTLDGGGHGAYGNTVSYEGLGTDNIGTDGVPGINLSLAAGTATYSDPSGHVHTDHISNFQNVIGSNGADHITGDEHDNIIDGTGSYANTGGSGTTTEDPYLADTLDGGGHSLGTIGDTLSYAHLGDTAPYSGVYVNLGDTAVTADGMSFGAHTATYSDMSHWFQDHVTDFQNIIGSDNGDDLFGDSHANIIHGGGGPDFIEGMGGSDTIDGGSYSGQGNTVSYEFLGTTDTKGVVVDLTHQWDADGHGTASYTGGTDVLNNIQNVIGSSHADILIGDSQDNTLEGLGGGDMIIGGGHSDGGDTVSYAHLGESVDVSLTTGVATYGSGVHDALVDIQNIIGPDYASTLTGDTHTNSILGGAGNDTIEGLGTHDISQSGDGSNESPYIGDHLDGGGGVNTISYEHLTSSVYGVTVNLSDSDISIPFGEGYLNAAAHTATYFVEDGYSHFADSLAHFQNVIGTSNIDIIVGDSHDNVIEGLGGGDILDGGGGVNTVSYQHMDVGVTVNLTNGYATYAGLYAGTDTLSNFQNIIGSDHGDMLIGDQYANHITDGAGNDIIEGLGGGDTLDGGLGVNTVSYQHLGTSVTVDLSGQWGGSGHGTANYSGGADILYNFENIIGSDHGDVLIGDSHANSITGGAGNDLIEGGGGSDHLDGGLGVNTVSYGDFAAGVTVDLTHQWDDDGYGTATHTGGEDTLNNIQNVIGSHHSDTITGDIYDNVIEGLGGSDALFGGGHGANGDTVSYQHYSDTVGGGVQVALTDGDGTASYFGGNHDTLHDFQNVIGSTHADTITGDIHDNVIEGLGGGDTLFGGGHTATDSLIGDTVSYQHLTTNGTGVVLNLGSLNDDYTQNAEHFYATATYHDAGGTVHTDHVYDFQNVIGSAFADTITGDAGNNIIEGMGSLDQTGGNGNYWEPRHGDTLDGGGGTDTVSYAHLGSSVFLNLSDTAIPLPFDPDYSNEAHSALYQDGGSYHTDSVTNFQNVIGTHYSDTITGDSHDNVIEGLGGGDALNGGSGDTLAGGGHDAYGDTVSYEHLGVGVTVYLDTTTHADQTGSYTYDGNWITDTLSDFQHIIGSAYNDSLYGDSHDNVINGMAGNDHIYGFDPNNHTDPSGDSMGDTLYGGAGDDTLYGGHGNTHMDGGDGNNTVDYSNADHPVTVDLSGGHAYGTFSDGSTPFTDTLTNIQNITGSHYADTLTGDDNCNIIHGGGGADTIDGGGGNNIIYDDGSAKHMTAGDGDNTFMISLDEDHQHNASVVGGAGENTLDFSAVPDHGQYFDYFVEADLSHTINSAPAAYASIMQISDGAGPFNTYSLTNIQNLVGSQGGDYLAGNSGSNAINGGAGDDFIFGHGSTDAGHPDVLTGGSGADIFYFSTASDCQNTTITDFHSCEGDKIGVDTSSSLFHGITYAGYSVESAASLAASAEGTGPTFVLDTTSHVLWYEATGSHTSAVAVATLTDVTTLHHDDITTTVHPIGGA